MQEHTQEQERGASKLFTVFLTEEQCRYLVALFMERVESHEIRSMTGYPQDEEGARFAAELWKAFLTASPQDNGNGTSAKCRVGWPVTRGRPA